jgi:heme/copper-type cytochrome/quinol oxidase subunit 3
MSSNQIAVTGGTDVAAPFMRSSKLGLWVFLASEIILFGGLIGSYIIMRIGNTAWAEASGHLSVPIGSLNTFILLTSSLTMVLALVAAARGEVTAGRWFLLATVVLGLVFIVIKGFEWSGKISHGLIPSTNGYWSFYYIMTGLHALHVLIGILINGLLWFMSLVGRRLLPAHRLDAAGLYWHFVDVVWIFLFPLLYLS